MGKPANLSAITSKELSPSALVYLGLFMVTLSTLMWEILLTRIFSVTMWYHFAFMAISVATFGMTVGALIVYLFPGFFSAERTRYHLALSAWLFAITTVLSFLAHMAVPAAFVMSARGILSIAATYIIVSIPFIFSGISVCLALTRYPRQVSKLYAADLVGAAAGCMLIVVVLKLLHDGPAAVVVTAFIASLGAYCFASGEVGRRAKLVIQLSLLVFASLAVAQSYSSITGKPLMHIEWSKGHYEKENLFERWNSFSRIRVMGNMDNWGSPALDTTSDRLPPELKTRTLYLDIDSAASTVLSHYDGNPETLEYLKYDISNMAHYLRRDADVMVVGVGGGRDILSALAFGQKSVLGLEINEDILYTLNTKYGDFTGHLDKLPNVRIVNDEARSFIARQSETYDIIQVALIDTWAATAAGAFVLTENTLYTTEAWRIFLDRLTPNGIVSFTRWYRHNHPVEIYRISALASTALLDAGVENPRGNVLILKKMVSDYFGAAVTMLSKTAFSPSDIEMVREVAYKMGFEVVLSPDYAENDVLKITASGKGFEAFDSSAFNLNPPDDDSPFFFNIIKLKSLLDKENWYLWTAMDFNVKAVFTLGALLLVVVFLTLLCIIVPLVLTTGLGGIRDVKGQLVFFSAIGFGFMLVEISQLQRLIVFLGHPSYGLSTVLFSLLVSGGIGSHLTSGIGKEGNFKGATWRLGLLLAILLAFGFLAPYITPLFQTSTTPVRILVAVAVLFPVGLFMGMAFPIGMKLASLRMQGMTPWFWGINGAMTVCSSVVAMVISMNTSISATFWTGFICYVVAFISYLYSLKGVRIKANLI